MTTILSFLFVIGALVFVHELGHLLAARRVGVRVLTFSIGFGPRLFATRRGGTDYCIRMHGRLQRPRPHQRGRAPDAVAALRS